MMGLKHPTAHDLRFVTVHAGEKFVFVKSAKLVFLTKRKLAEYRVKMDSKRFEKSADKTICCLPCDLEA
jgi:hypothetical protein